MLKIIAYIFFGSLFAPVLLAQKSQEPAEKSTEEPAQEFTQEPSCDSDDDCKVVPVGCCGCEGGGMQMAVYKDYTARTDCGDKSCPSQMSEHKSCQGKAVCKAKKCVLDNEDEEEITINKE